MIPLSRKTKRSTQLRRRQQRLKVKLADSEFAVASRIAKRAQRNENTLTREAIREASQFLRTSTVGGLVMLAATIIALIWANSPWQGGYHALFGTVIGPEALHLDMPLKNWISDGLLAIFFFVVGLELKRELVVGQLRSPKLAILPVFAAVGGMVIPGLIGWGFSRGVAGAEQAWAVPLATDIAFAVAVLAIVASNLPSGVRIFLLSVAVVDDLGAILIIAVVFTTDVGWVDLAIAAGLLVVYAVLQKLRFQGPLSSLVYVPLGLAVWFFIHAGGIHATIAGVALGLLTRVKSVDGEEHAPAVRLEHRIQPISAGFVVPLFALAAAGITVNAEELAAILSSPMPIGIILGLVLGKPIGVLLGSFIAVKARLARLPAGVRWGEIASIGMLAGIGFTVSLLIGELAFDDEELLATGKMAVLVASFIASVLGAIVVKMRDRAHADHDSGG